MSDRAWLAPLTGLAFVVLTIVSFTVFGEPPQVDEPVQEIVDFYVDNKDGQTVAALVEGIAATLFVFFGVVVRRALRRPDGTQSSLGDAALAGTVIFATGLAIDATISFALAETAGDIDAAAVQALTALWHNDFMPFAVGLQVFLLAVGIAIVRYGTLWRWLGWVAIILGILALTPIGFAAFIGSGLVILVLSVALAMRAKGPRRPAVPTEPVA